MSSPSQDPRVRARQKSDGRALDNTITTGPSALKRRPSTSPHRDPPLTSKILRSDSGARLVHLPRSRESTIDLGQSSRSTIPEQDGSSLRNSVTSSSKQDMLELLMSFGDQSVQLALAQTELAKRESRYKRALDDYNTSLHPRYQAFPAIREQQATAHRQAEAELTRTRQLHATQKSQYAQTARNIADVLDRAYQRDDLPAGTQTRLEEVSRDLNLLKSEYHTHSQTFAQGREQGQIHMQALDERLVKETAALRERVVSNESAIDHVKQRIDSSEARKETADVAKADDKQAVSALTTRFNLFQASQAGLTKRVDGLDKALTQMDSVNEGKEIILAEEMLRLTTEHKAFVTTASARLGALEQDGRLEAARQDLQRVQADLQELSQKVGALNEDAQRQGDLPPTQPVRTLAEVYGATEFTPISPSRDPRRNKAPQTDERTASAETPHILGADGPVGSKAHQHTLDEIEVLKVGVRSLNSRFNNLTTDTLAKQMLHQLCTLYPDLQTTQQTITYIRRELDETRTVNADVKVQALSQQGELENMRTALGVLSIRVDQLRASDTADTTATRIIKLSASLEDLEKRLSGVTGVVADVTAQFVKQIVELQNRVSQGEHLLKAYTRNHTQEDENRKL